MKFTESEENILSLFSSGYWEELDIKFQEENLNLILNTIDLSEFPIENIFNGTIKEKIKCFYFKKFKELSNLIPLEEMIIYSSRLIEKLNHEHDPQIKKYSTFHIHPSSSDLISDIRLIKKLSKEGSSSLKREDLTIDEINKIYEHIIKFILFSGTNSITVYDRYAFKNILINKNINLLFSILNDIAQKFKIILNFKFHSVFHSEGEKKHVLFEIQNNHTKINNNNDELKKKFKNLKIECNVYIDDSEKVINNHSRFFLFSDICFFADKGILMLSIDYSSKPKRYILDLNFKPARLSEKNEISEYIAKTKPSYTFG